MDSKDAIRTSTILQLVLNKVPYLSINMKNSSDEKVDGTMDIIHYQERYGLIF